MIVGTFYFKQKAREALRGNWQTALVVTFFSGIFLTLASVLQTLWLPDPVVYVSYGMYDRFTVEISAVADSEWMWLGVVSMLSLLLSPALALGCNRYFIHLLRGEDIGVKSGLLGRMRILFKAVWLYVVMGVRIFLWSLLLVVPGILAAIRYSMAPYYMAQNPELSASEAIAKSKAIMTRNQKFTYVGLMISFIGWSLLANVAQMFLMSISTVVALVAAQFMQVAISAYMNGACASFFLTISTKEGRNDAQRAMRTQMEKMGMDMDGAGMDGAELDDGPEAGAKQDEQDDQGELQ